METFDQGFEFVFVLGCSNNHQSLQSDRSASIPVVVVVAAAAAAVAVAVAVVVVAAAAVCGDREQFGCRDRDRVLALKQRQKLLWP